MRSPKSLPLPILLGDIKKGSHDVVELDLKGFFNGVKELKCKFCLQRGISTTIQKKKIIHQSTSFFFYFTGKEQDLCLVNLFTAFSVSFDCVAICHDGTLSRNVSSS